ncbi:Outer membrane protein beta-barrel domain-containing protein [Pricia antarctica]|uniref:Outer membrane protein beta-barrel domain-containing protein n=1 Tax=Pricia antarctica TaxID=641691 RepID=A0A1G6X163_9FLAO|nr:outer membrane beta-barrel protein [Pricia antarctica]SDD71036.1 Outer membrane protein beta-barrel domain-containing protein [Pricia antarctica]
MDKKKLDELFREKFKTFREVPDKKVWTAIENSLDKKRKKRAIPLWWQLGGVAAVLAIALFTFYSLTDSEDETPAISNTEKKNVKDIEQDDLDAGLKKDEKDALQIPETTEDAVVNSSGDTDLENTEKYPAAEVDGVSGSQKSYSVYKSKEQKDAFQISEIDKDAVADSRKEDEDTDKYSNPKTGADSFQDTLPDTDVSITDATFPKDNSTKDSVTNSPEKTELTTKELVTTRKNDDRDYASEDKKNIVKMDKPHVIGDENRDAVAIAEANTSKKTDTSKKESMKNPQDGTVVNQENPKTISENQERAIAQNDQIEKEGTNTNENKKSIFKALEEQVGEEKIAQEPSSRWSVGPNVAPVYFNAMGEGSPIDPGFSPNAKSGSTNLSYGVSIAYDVTKKLRVRSGIHKAEYGYNTNNVGFSPTLAASTSGRLQNIDFASGSVNFAESSPNSNLDSSNDLAPEFSSLNAARDGTIAQSFGYLEVPLELDYALIDRRFGVNLVGGISSLFLIDNSIILNSGELTTEIGEARNLNDLNFSTNIGFGVNYRFTPKVQLNIEPVFKYQLNTFSNVSGDFRPFSIGVYSGLNFKF